MMVLRKYFLLFLLGSQLFNTLVAQEISLKGTWRFAIDKNDKGIDEKWFAQKLSDAITLPGSMAENLKGDDITINTQWTGSIYDSSFYFNPRLAKYRQPGNVKFPFWLTPAKHYAGAAWYQKDVEIPTDWIGRKIILYLERVHTETRVWVDNKEVGMQNTMVVPHEFDLTTFLTQGRHVISLRIDNRIKEINVGPDSHSLTDHTQGNWNGVIGNLFLQAKPSVFIYSMHVYPDIKNKHAHVKLLVINGQAKKISAIVSVSASSLNSSVKHKTKPVKVTVAVNENDSAFVDIKLPMGEEMLLWDEFNPSLYELLAQLKTSGVIDEQRVQFGMREFKTEGTGFLINNRPVFLRGTVNCSEFPLTGYPSMDVAAWERIFKIAKLHGLNHMRFHSWCPPAAAFVAADKIGFYLQPEAPTWPNHGVTIGDGRTIDKFIYDETIRLNELYGDHPSFCMLAAGNEPAGKKQATYLAEFVQYWQKKDSRHVYTGASVGMSWPLVPENEYMVKSGPRGLHWDKVQPESQSDYRAAIAGFTVPYVTHEMGQWCVFPNFKEIKKYTGVYKAKNFELFQEDLKDHFMENRAEDFFMASGKLQALCYKSEIEKTMRTPGLAGFQLLGLQDFPGQGTALIGMIDAFWDDKGYITGVGMKRFCNSTVLLSRFPKFVFTNDDTLKAGIELFHFGNAALKSAVVRWTVKDAAGNIVKEGKFPAQTYSIGNALPVGNVQLPLFSFSKAQQLKLEVSIEGTTYTNDWDFWVYPSDLKTTSWGDVYYCTALDATAKAILTKGGKVFLNASNKIIKGKEVSMYYTPVFWNTSWFKMRAPHVTGMYIQKDHSVFKDFPTENYNTLQWWEVMNRAQVMNLEDFPPGFQPIVQPIDTWFMNRRLALILEAKVGNGSLIISTAQLSEEKSKPAARQLMYSIQQYMNSPAFQPKEKIDIQVINDLFTVPSKETWDSYTNATPDELKPIQQKSSQK